MCIIRQHACVSTRARALKCTWIHIVTQYACKYTWIMYLCFPNMFVDCVCFNFAWFCFHVPFWSAMENLKMGATICKVMKNWSFLLVFNLYQPCKLVQIMSIGNYRWEWHTKIQEGLLVDRETYLFFIICMQFILMQPTKPFILRNDIDER